MFPSVAHANEPRVSFMAQTVFVALADAEYGALFQYPDFRKLIFEDPQGRRGRQAILIAARRLRDERNKLLLNVRGVGYQVVQPRENAGEVVRMKAGVLRNLGRQRAILVHTDLVPLTPGELQQHSELLRSAQIQIAVHKNIARAELTGTASAVVVSVPAGRQLAQLLQGKP